MSGVVCTDDSKAARLGGLAPQSVTMRPGFWADRMAANLRGIDALGARLESEGVVDNFRRMSGGATGPRRGLWFTDSDLYKWIEAATWALATTPEGAEAAGLELRLDAVIDAVIAAQASDGYLNTAFHSDRFRDLTTSHELYCAGHLFQAAVAQHRVTGDERMLVCATRVADHLRTQFGPGLREEADAHPGVEIGMIELGRETGTSGYLDLARFFVDRVDHRALRELAGHAVRAQYYACALEDLALETDDEELGGDVDRLWESLVATRSYVTGGVGGRWLGESVGRAYELPNESAYAETCAAVACVMWAWRRLLRTADPSVADHIELTLHNAVLVGMSLEGTEWSYVNPLGDAGSAEHDPWQHDLAGFNLWFVPSRRHDFHPVTCCPPNVNRLLASLPGYVFGTSGEDAWVHLYAASQARVGPLVLTQGTDAPWDGRVELVVDEVDGAERDVPLHLRIPGWCASAHASVNGEPVRAAVTPGSYLRIQRRWQRGDRVELALAMEPELLVGHPRLAEARGAVAVRRGPLVYCAEEVDHPGVDVLAAGLRIDRPVVAERRDDMLGGVVTLRASGVAPEPEPALYRPLARGPSGRAAAGDSVGRPVDLVLVPYWAWANRGLGAMAVWLRRDADAMETSGRVPPARPRRASRFAPLSRNALVRLPKPMIKTFSTMHRVAVSASGGRVGMRFRGEPLILLTTTGRKTGKDRTWPLVGLPVESGGWVIAASYGGHDAHPAWYLNLQAHPEATVQEGRRHVKVRAREASPAEHAEHWSRFVDLLDTYAEYQDATDRQIPVVMLEPVA